MGESAHRYHFQVFALDTRLDVPFGADRDQVLTQALGAPLSDAPQRLTDFIEQLGVKTRFADYGVSDDEASRMVAHAMGGPRGKNFIGAADSLAPA